MAIVNKTDLAEYLGLTLKGVDDMVRRGCPYLRKGSGRGREWQFDTAAVREWREDRIRREVADRDDAKVVSLDRERALKTAAERQLAEEELARLRREYAPVEAVAELVDREYGNVRARILVMANKLAPMMPRVRKAAEARQLIAREIREALHELSSGSEIARAAAGGDPPTRGGASEIDAEESPTSA